MRAIRFVEMGSGNNVAIHNLVCSLNSVQSQFEFLFDDDVLSPKGLDVGSPVSAAILEALALKYATRKYPRDYPIAVCDYPLEDDISVSFDDKLALISTHKWAEELSFSPIHICLAYSLTDILLSLYVPTLVHYETRGCPMDYCDHRPDMQMGLLRCDFCSECRSEIVRAIGSQRITLQQVAAIYKILDFVAGRRNCFVIMPFKKESTKIYERYIRPTVLGGGWTCQRADEVLDPMEIINLIAEQILRADLIVADLTGRSPNVFYELGYAHAMNKNTVLITQSIDDVPFDLRHRQLIGYSPTRLGYKRLTEALKRFL